MKILLVLLLLTGSVRSADMLDTYRGLIDVVTRKFNSYQADYKYSLRGDEYLWQFLSVRNFPYGCLAETLSVDTSRIVHVDSVIIYRQGDEPLQIRVAVCSSMKRNVMKFRMVQLLFFQRNNCCWEEWRDPLRVVERKVEEVYICEESP